MDLQIFYHRLIDHNTDFEYHLYYLCAQITKFTLRILCIGGEIYLDMDKIWRANVYTCINMKQLETDYHLLKVGNNRSINLVIR